MLHDSRFNVQCRQEIFLISKLSRLGLGPEVLLFNGYWGFFPLGINHPGPDADHSHPLVLRLRMSGALALLLLYAFMVNTWKTLTFYLFMLLKLYITEK